MVDRPSPENYRVIDFTNDGRFRNTRRLTKGRYLDTTPQSTSAPTPIPNHPHPPYLPNLPNLPNLPAPEPAA